MKESIQNVENDNLYKVKEELSLAKVMPDSYWDSVASDKIDETMRERLDLILDLIDDYY